MKQSINNNQGFSIVVAVFMIGFLLVLTTGVFNLVLREMKDNRGAENYLKAYAGAEGAMELGLLNIKEKGYATDTDLKKNQPGSKSLTFSRVFKEQSDPLISYETEIATFKYEGILGTGSTVIIPLFTTGSGGITEPDLNITNGVAENVIWNIIGNGEGMSGSGGFDKNTSQKYKQNDGKYSSSEKSISYFLNQTGNNSSYLMLFNKSSSEIMKYKLSTQNSDIITSSTEFFSKPVGNITSSVTVGKYRQNISTSIDNTQFLNMLKYSVFSK